MPKILNRNSWSQKFLKLSYSSQIFSLKDSQKKILDPKNSQKHFVAKISHFVVCSQNFHGTIPGTESIHLKNSWSQKLLLKIPRAEIREKNCHKKIL